ncbi:zinc-binding dehydrogenase [Gordonia humi]|uniref:NADPH:quinone reductase-like Zn-dependent oxidoreductase n=1 Tax=Gordonia humi TaxID=686429 RepID=A0A840EMQ3_9ACTN|nr:zinc-binding dehydrogenase [Gordonia humi]MBB4134075.1 NADPH:quinone reductase-like Zn-dependent oxidoreductase [Gordonia humi]
MTTTTDTVLRIVLPGLVEPNGLELDRGRPPTPGSDQVLLRMEATGVSFAEQQMRRGKYFDQPPFPFVPGYDVVGTVVAVGSDASPDLIGRRFAAVTKTGGWAQVVAVDAADLLAVPAGVSADEIETVVVNGITAWQMLAEARVPDGGTIVVFGVSGGVGGMLAQLAALRDITVIGTASARHHDDLTAHGIRVVDSRAGDVHRELAALAPNGVDAVFDHIGGDGIVASWRLLRRGGSLISYGTAATKDDPGNARLPVLKLFGRLYLWNMVPNGRRARFYNFWKGKKLNAKRFHSKQRDAAAAVFSALADGRLTPAIAARFPLAEAGRALALAESRTTSGKIVLTP